MAAGSHLRAATSPVSTRMRSSPTPWALGWPFGSIVVLALVTGIWLVIIGIAGIISAFRTRRAGEAVKEGVERLRGSSGSHAAR